MNKTNNDNQNTAPIHTARAGAIRASVWVSPNRDGQPQYKIIISRMFRQNEGWQRGHTFYSDQLCAIVEAVASVQRWIDQRRRQESPPNPENA
jgi:hypothetical protein